MLLHLVDVSDGAAVEPAEAHRVITTELERAAPELADKPRLVVATKVEDERAEERARGLSAAIDRPVLCMSSATGRGVREVLRSAFALSRGPRSLRSPGNPGSL